MVVRLNHLPTPLKAKAGGRTDTSHDSTAFLNLAGDNSEEATPDPIPNSEVKLFCVDGTARVTVWESRTSPAFFCLFFDKNRSHERRFFLGGAFFWAPPFVVFANQHASYHERVRGLDLARSWIDPDSVQLARLACLNPHASLIDARIEPWCRHGATVRSAAPRRICEANRRGYDKTGVCLDYRHTGRLGAALFMQRTRRLSKCVFWVRTIIV